MQINNKRSYKKSLHPDFFLVYKNTFKQTIFYEVIVVVYRTMSTSSVSETVDFVFLDTNRMLCERSLYFCRINYL